MKSLFNALSLLAAILIAPSVHGADHHPHATSHKDQAGSHQEHATGQHDHARHQEAISEVEIARLPVTYAWAVDTKDIDLLMTVFSEDIVYDLSAYDFPSATGKAAVRQVFLTGILPNVRCSFISISNIRVELKGETASGGDYFVHAGYDPVDRPKLTRSHTEGQHFYEFKREAGVWKISRMSGSPFFERFEPYDPKGLKRCK